MGTALGPDSETAGVTDIERADVAGLLAQRFAAWSTEPIARHILAILLLVLVAGSRWWRQVFDPLPQNDETAIALFGQRVVGVPCEGLR